MWSILGLTLNKTTVVLVAVALAMVTSYGCGCSHGRSWVNRDRLLDRHKCDGDKTPDSHPLRPFRTEGADEPAAWNEPAPDPVSTSTAGTFDGGDVYGSQADRFAKQSRFMRGL